jgi:TRAP-type C4-dicarboxylate transport system substrate-binding protein
MRKNLLFRALGFTVLVLTIASLAACSGKKDAASSGSTGTTAAAPAAKTFKWKMGSIYNDPVSRPDFNGWGWSMQKFIELVNERTNGQVVIEPFFNSVLGANPELFEQLRRGELEVFYGQPMATVDARFGAFSIPYIFKDYDDVEKLIANPDAPLFKLSQGWIQENRGYLLCSGVAVFRGFFNTKHRVATVSDLRDLKARIYEDPVVNIFWKSICNASAIAYSEVYTALQTKTVDGLEFADTSVLSSKYYELGKFFSDIDWQWTWGANIVISQNAWNQLPADLQKIVSECGWEAMQVQKTVELESKAQAEEALSGFGVDVYHLSSQDRQTWVDYARSLDGQIRDAVGADAFNAIMNAVK